MNNGDLIKRMHKLRVGGIPVFLVSQNYWKITVSHPYVCNVTGLVAQAICLLCYSTYCVSTIVQVQASVWLPYPQKLTTVVSTVLAGQLSSRNGQ